MKLKERFLNAVNGRPVDRPPVAAITTGITTALMDKAGIYWPEAHSDSDQLAGLAESIHLYTRTECIKLPFCMTIEVEALGAEINFRTRDTLPSESVHIYDHPSQLAIPDDFFERGRVPTVLRAIEKLSRKYQDEVPIVTSIVGPFSLAGKLFGFNNFLVWLIEQPEWVHQIMAGLTPLAIQYANAQVEAGADAVIVGEATCSGDLISPKVYRDFILPYHQQLCPAVNAPTLLHICGKSTRHLPYIAESGASAYSFDEGVDIQEANRHLKGKVALAGYVPTVSVLLNGTHEDVYRSAVQCLENGVDLLTPGCAMAPYTPLDNIDAMVQALYDWATAKHGSVITKGESI